MMERTGITDPFKPPLPAYSVGQRHSQKNRHSNLETEAGARAQTQKRHFQTAGGGQEGTYGHNCSLLSQHLQRDHGMRKRQKARGRGGEVRKSEQDRN